MEWATSFTQLGVSVLALGVGLRIHNVGVGLDTLNLHVAGERVMMAGGVMALVVGLLLK